MNNPYSNTDTETVIVHTRIAKADRDFLRRVAPVHGLVSGVAATLIKGLCDELRTIESPDEATFQSIVERRAK